MVQECIVFGDAKPQVGALILPSEQGAELSKNRKAYIEAIWPVIAEANAAAPTHSRILPEMVEILPYDTEIPVVSEAFINFVNHLIVYVSLCASLSLFTHHCSLLNYY